MNNLFWNGPNSFQKRNISISIKYSNQMFQFIKECLNTYIKPHIQSKVILSTNSASMLQLLQPWLDDWLDTVDNFKGDAVLVIGNKEMELKLAYTVAFTAKLSNDYGQDDNVFYP